MDPPVDSDMDRTNNRMSRDSGYNTHHYSDHSNPASNAGYGASNSTTVPHNSNLMNKANPRLDSDNSRGEYGNTAGHYSSPTGAHGSNATGTGHGTPGSSATGPHGSRAANKVDPRVDVDNARGHYGNTPGNYSTPTGAHGTATGPHVSSLANTTDPHVNSDHHRGNSGNAPGTHNNPSTGVGYGNGPGNTSAAGPHKSNFMNKLDPCVDSDMDSSRNAGMTNPQGMSHNNTGTFPQEISSHGHATGPPAGALEGRHAKHISGPHRLHSRICVAPEIYANVRATGNVTNATANASISGGMAPQGSASASGPTSADAGTTSSNQGGLKGAIRNMGSGMYPPLSGSGRPETDKTHKTIMPMMIVEEMVITITRVSLYPRTGITKFTVSKGMITTMNMVLVLYRDAGGDDLRRRQWGRGRNAELRHGIVTKVMIELVEKIIASLQARIIALVHSIFIFLWRAYCKLPDQSAIDE
jgi:hypothetical protein